MTAKLPIGYDHNFGPREGKVHVAFTNRGTNLRVWVPAPGNGPNDRYFCHGRTLNTYNQYGYSVFSGDDVLKALIDEHNPLPHLLNTLMLGDIIAWRNPATLEVIHTASVVNIPAVHRTVDNISVWTKNGFNPESVVTLNAVCGVYGVNYTFWR